MNDILHRQYLSENSLRSFELCDMTCYPADSSHQKIVTLRSWRDRKCQQHSVSVKYCLNNTACLRCSKCATKTWPKLLYHPQQSKWLIQDWMDQCFYAAYTIFWPCHLNVVRPGKYFSALYCPMLFSLCKLWPQFPVLVWSSAVVVYLPDSKQ